jgi:hypothetical protein
MDDFSMIKPLGAHIGRGIHMIFFWVRNGYHLFQL